MTNGLSAGAQRIRSVKTRGMLVPLKFTLGTSAAIVKAVPLLLVDLLNEDGVTGRAYAFCYRPSGAVAISSHLSEAVDLLKGKDATPFDAMQTLSRQFALLGVTGAVRMALSLLDMAMWDAENYLHIVDRKKDIIISGGENISSIEVERAIASHPAVLECAVVSAPDAQWGEVPATFVTVKPGHALDERVGAEAKCSAVLVARVQPETAPRI